MKKITLTLYTLAYMLICTLSSNAQWQKTGFPAGLTVNCFASIGANVFAGTDSGLYISKDDGVTWSLTGLTSPVSCLGVSGNNIFTVTQDGEVHLSKDYGTTWSGTAKLPVPTYTMCVNEKGIFVPTENGDDSLFVYLSTDTGASWSVVLETGGVQGFIPFSYCSGTTICFEDGEDYLFFQSNDNGVNWSYNSGIDQQINAVAIVGNIEFYAYGKGSSLFNGIACNTTSGSDWKISLNYPDNALMAVGGDIFAGTDGNGVFLSVDTGNSWTAINNGLTDSVITQLGTNSTSLFAADSIGEVWKLSLTGITTSVNNISENISFTIYPDPAATQLTIQTSSFHNESVMVSVMNVLGQEASPPAPLQRRGENAVIDISRLSAGIYFLQMKWEGGSVVKKFVKE